MTVVVTCGPSYEPIDHARRITNFSTGRLGIALSNVLAGRGLRVICFKGEMAPCPNPLVGAEHRPFSTNDDLARQLEGLSRSETIDAVLHAAALADFRVEQIRNEAGNPVSSPKFSTREGKLHLTVSPALKVLPRLRAWFPSARIIGWKYELEGTRAEAFSRAWNQIKECGTDACVLNGAAYGPGYALCHPQGEFEDCANVPALVQAILKSLR